jgi:hypothetical protein
MSSQRFLIEVLQQRQAQRIANNPEAQAELKAFNDERRDTREMEMQRRIAAAEFYNSGENK